MTPVDPALVESRHNRLSGIDGMDIWGAMQVCRFPTMQANLVRLVLILKFGGFWSDLKNVVLRPFLQEVAAHKLVLVEHQPMPDPRPPGYLTNSFFGAEAGHPFLKTCLEEAILGIKRREEGSLSKITGLVLMNRLYTQPEQATRLGEYLFLEQETAWRHNMKRVGASYQRGGKHWSEMQKGKSLYVS